MIEDDEELETLDKSNQQIVVNESKTQEIQTKQTTALQEKMNNKMMNLMDSVVDSHDEELKNLTDKAFKNEIEIREVQTAGRKKTEKLNVDKNITHAKAEDDKEKHERAKTILSAMGLTNQLPKIFRITALIVGYPFYVLYLLSFGWIIEFFTFIVKGFITMVADCMERFADVNSKIIKNENSKDFKLGKALTKICWGVLIIGVIITIVVLFFVK